MTMQNEDQTVEQTQPHWLIRLVAVMGIIIVFGIVSVSHSDFKESAQSLLQAWAYAAIAGFYSILSYRKGYWSWFAIAALLLLSFYKVIGAV